MIDTLDPALEAALDPKALQAAWKAFGRHAFYEEYLVAAIRAYLAVAAPQAEIDRLREALRACKERLRALDQGRSIHNSRFPDKAIEDGGLWDMGDIIRQADAALHAETPNGGQNG